MTRTLRYAILLTLLLAMLLMAVSWAWSSYCQSRRQWTTALAETANCRQLVTALEKLRKGSDVVDAGEMPEEQLYQRIHQAVAAAGLEEEKVIRSIRPQAGHAVRDGSYQQKTVELSLTSLTLEQLMRLLHHLQSVNPRLPVSALTLHEPKGYGTASLWSVDPLVLSYRVPIPAAKTAANP